MAPVPVTPTLAIDDGEIAISFARAAGPGGQNVELIATGFDTLTTISKFYDGYGCLADALIHTR